MSIEAVTLAMDGVGGGGKLVSFGLFSIYVVITSTCTATFNFKKSCPTEGCKHIQQCQSVMDLVTVNHCLTEVQGILTGGKG